MGEGADEGDRVAGLIESQRKFYDLRPHPVVALASSGFCGDGGKAS